MRMPLTVSRAVCSEITIVWQYLFLAEDDAEPLIRFLNTELELETPVNTKDAEEPPNAQTDVGQPEIKGGVDANARADTRSANEAASADSRENIASIGEAPKYRRGAAGSET
jgi:hypothetical protein